MTTATTFTPIETFITGVPYATLCRWCRKGRIVGAVKIGRRWFVRQTETTAKEDVRAHLRSLGFPV